jgi:hypothetical protein
MIQIHCKLAFVRSSSKRLRLLCFIVHSENFHPLAVIEVAMSICERAFQQLVNLRDISKSAPRMNEIQDYAAHTSRWSILSPTSLNHFLISSVLTIPVSFSSKLSNASRSSASVSNSNNRSLIIVRNIVKLIPLSGDESSFDAAEEYRLWVPGRALRRSSIMCLEGAIPGRVINNSNRIYAENTPRLENISFKSCSFTHPSLSWSMS